MKRHPKHKEVTGAQSTGLRKIPTGAWVRLGCIATLWILLCYLLISTRPMTLWLIFTIIASGIIVFVPLYKKYVRNAKN